MLPSDIYGQPAATYPVLDEAKVVDLARRYVHLCSAVTGIDQSNSEARINMVDDDLIFKVQRPHQLRARTGLEKDVFSMNKLAYDSEIVVARVIRHEKMEALNTR